MVFEDIFTKRFESLLSSLTGVGAESVNAGVSNYNIEQEWAYLKRKVISKVQMR